MKVEDAQQVLYELRKSKEFIKANWEDSIAEQYLMWTEEVEKTLKDCFKQQCSIYSTLSEIQGVCEDAINDGDDEKPKEKVKARTRF